MITIVSMKVEKTAIMPPPEGYNSEIEFIEDGVTYFIHVFLHSDSHYSLAKESIYDYMTDRTDEFKDVEFIEEYETLEETEKSKYYKYYKLADELIDKIIE